MSLLDAGNMRFRWNEQNENREAFINSLCSSEKQAARQIAQVELIHSKIIFDISSAKETFNKQGDGIITKNKSIIPIVTVADCVPIFIYDKNSNYFGVLHSGWKGTGILEEAFNILSKKYNSCAKDFCVVIGPHINSCCYKIDEERSNYFVKSFTPICVKETNNEKFLDLTLANLSILKKIGVPKGNIFVQGECTCCYKENNKFKYGSFRRQTSLLSQGMPLLEKQKYFTVQAAFIVF